ncbi:pyrroline-5-carboxylate reductase [Evansella caseinilytica]|uniref:Pyrroline-5-carboxylate reductase n=1 Tax=Evansella caseinilytica TaxID=1503961 RepID=A0A1H3RV17_9BACI|nr:pyrroline-5-carboxylate reductase [Evansella caseinilytica]SDZ29574.1 pyrroline-5-carboxylate reductase [Evansella caseinilytica]
MTPIHMLMIGAGRMAQAIISGLRNKNSPEFGRITVTNFSDKKRLQQIAAMFAVHSADRWQEEVRDHQVIVLATPPETQDELLRALAPHLEKQLIITVAAGIDPSYMEKRLGKEVPVCWMMPNTAAQVGKSMTIFTCGKAVNEQQRKIISLLLDAIGESEELTEQQVHDMTAITGSAPAFVYTFVEALERAAMDSGVSAEQARRLVVPMLSGSAAMLEGGSEPAELIRQVASPGGATAEGLRVLDNGKFQAVLHEAVNATNRHARNSRNEITTAKKGR